MKILKIGTIVFIVNKASKQQKLPNLKVLPAKIVGYQNIDGKVEPILKWGRVEICPKFNIIFTDLKAAIRCMKL